MYIVYILKGRPGRGCRRGRNCRNKFDAVARPTRATTVDRDGQKGSMEIEIPIGEEHSGHAREVACKRSHTTEP